MDAKKSKKQHFKKQNLSLKSQLDNPKILQKLQKQQIVHREEIPLEKKAPLFLHLPQYNSSNQIIAHAAKYKDVVPEGIVRFCVHRSKQIWKESEQNIIELFSAIKIFFSNYKPLETAQQGIKTDLEIKTNFIIQFVSDCIGISIAVGNVIKQLKVTMNRILSRMSVKEAKPELIKFLDNFLQDKIVVAQEKIIASGEKLVREKDVVLIFGNSQKIIQIICISKPKQVVYVSRGNIGEDEEDLKILSDNKIECLLININAIPNYIRKVDKVLIEAFAVFSNGATLAAIGSAMVGLVANEQKIPVIVCCESFKLTDRVQLDPIVFNEVDSPDEYIKKANNSKDMEVLKLWREIKSLKILNLRYDIVPSHFATLILTEHGSIPPSSVSVINGRYNKI